jgi:hypothetical protein
MYGKREFTDALEPLYVYYSQTRPRFYKHPMERGEEIDRAWRLYSNAAQAERSMLLLGGDWMRTDKPLLQNLGTTATNPAWRPKPNKRGNSHTAPHASNRKGSVLNELGWWPLPNDAWLLGGVNALCKFYLANPTMPEKQLLWDSKEGRPRVLGRELIGLATFGYGRVAHKYEEQLGVVFAPIHTNKASQASFRDYLDAIGTFTCADDVLNLFQACYICY